MWNLLKKILSRLSRIPLAAGKKEKFIIIDGLKYRVVAEPYSLPKKIQNTYD